MTTPPAPRYELREVPVPLRQSFRAWLRGLKSLRWNWSRTSVVMHEVRPGEPGYDNAPYEIDIVWGPMITKTPD